MTRLAHTPNTAIIVGGSLVGLATAIRLAHEGLSVTVLERGPRFGDDIGLGIDRRQLSRVIGVSAFGDSEHPALPVIATGRESTNWKAVRGWLRTVALATPGVRLLANHTVISTRSEDTRDRGINGLLSAAILCSRACNRLHRDLMAAHWCAAGKDSRTRKATKVIRFSEMSGSRHRSVDDAYA
jgi:NADPH-dependent 2,4-dienoyl-CoA reductase/sulfur reductase-like enzyme